MRDENKSKKLIKISKATIAALLLGAAFLLPQIGIALTLPTTACDNQQAATAHLTATTSLEDGTKAFVYGSNSNFVSRTGDLVTFNVSLLFTPEAPAYIKAYFMDSNCTVGAGMAFGDTFSQTPTVSYDFATDTFTAGGQSSLVRSNTGIKYIWIEVWDGINGSTAAGYSYLVDTDNIQNPTGGDELPSEPDGLRPVLIIPGIMGSELYDGSDFIWPNVGMLLDRVHDSFLLASLSLDNNGNSIKNITVGDIVDQIIVQGLGISFSKTDTFSALTTHLQDNNYNYFVFPYDWRLNLDNSVDLLKNKITEIKTETGFFKINIIAHSMGGLLTKNYINQYGSDDINKLIFVGTPHLGAPKSAKVLLSGDTDIPFNILNKDTIKQLSLNSPSTYQLLPSPKYFDTYRGYLTLVDSNNTLLNYNASKHFLENKNLNSNLLNQAEVFFDKELNDLDYDSVQVANIAGCGLATQSAYSFLPDRNFIISTAYSSGDSTVPLVSADQVNASSLVKYYAKRVKHSELPSSSEVRQLILGILGDNVTLTSNVSTSSTFCGFTGKQLTWKSPVEIHIYDQLGNHAGPTDDGGFENNIPGVDYEIINGEKYIFIPSNDGNAYTIEGLGENTGTFDLVISDINDGDIVSSAIYNDVEITSASLVSVDTSGAQANVQFDFEGDGNANNLESDSILTGDAVSDRITPVTTATESGGDFGPKQITLSANDDNSGILSTNYSFTGSDYEPYTDPIIITQAGTTMVYFYSVDRAGNNESVKNTTVSIGSIGGGGVREIASIPEDIKTPIPIESENQGEVLGESIEQQPTIPEKSTTSIILDSSDGRTVFIIGKDGKKYGFDSERIFKELGYSFEKTTLLDASPYELGGIIEAGQMAHPNGSLILNGGIIWYIHDGKRSAFPNMEVFESWGYSLNQIRPAYEFDMNLHEDELIKNKT